MDAASILQTFKTSHAPLSADLQFGPVIAPVTIHKATPYGIVFSGQCAPKINDSVTVILRGLKAQGIISARMGRRSALLFVRPARSF